MSTHLGRPRDAARGLTFLLVAVALAALLGGRAPRGPFIPPGPALTPNPKPSATSDPSPTPPPPTLVPPSPTPSPLPTVSVDQFWRRMHGLTLSGVFDTLRPLPADRRGDTFLGINSALSEMNWAAPAMEGSGAGLDRVQIRWDEVEPSPGVFNFDQLDRIAFDARRWHLSVLAVVDGAPAWAVDRPERVGAGPPRGLDAPAFWPDGTPNPANPWAEFLATVARRYGDRVAAWEIWNEPNLPESWRGTPDDYARMLATSRAVLQEEAPGAPMLVAGMVEDDGRFLRKTLAALCPNQECPDAPFDGVAWHIYNDPLGVSRVAGQTRAILAAYHLAADPWITEANVAVDDPEVPSTALMPEPRVSLDQQAAFVIQTYALARAEGVRSVAVYRATDIPEAIHDWGLFRADQSPRPALLAYRTVATWMSRARFVSLTHPTPTSIKIELRRDADAIDVLWSTTGAAATVRVPSQHARATLVDSLGRQTAVEAAGGGFAVKLPAAAGRHPGAPPLAPPVILVTAG